MSPSTIPASTTPSSRVHRLARVTRRVAITLAVVLAGAAGWQALAERHDRRTLPRPGRMVSIDGTSLHLDCRGSGDGPTIVLEAGATGFAATWAWVQQELVQSHRVCSYDRAGMGWSAPSVAPRHASVMAGELRQALHAAGERAPFVLVGHSLGGVLVQAYTAQYPADVSGLVLVDPSHPEQTRRFGAATVEAFEGFVRLIGHASSVARLGVLRLANPLAAPAATLPPAARVTADLFAASPSHLATSHAELAAWDTIMTETQTLLARRATRGPAFDDRPLVVLSAEQWPNDLDGALTINHRMHQETASLSARGQQRIVPGSDHMSLLMNRAHASAVASAIRGVHADARGHTSRRTAQP